MKCPKCDKEMQITSKDFSYDFRIKPKKKYSRKIYWCKDDDTNVEGPIVFKY